MPIKSFRPITPTLRFQTKLVNDDLTTDKPHKPLLAVKPRTGGRNNTGGMKIRHQGGGHGRIGSDAQHAIDLRALQSGIGNR